MKQLILVFLLGVFALCSVFGQETIVTGSVVHSFTLKPVEGVNVHIENSRLNTKTDAQGVFYFKRNIPLGEQVLQIKKEGYEANRYPIVVNEGKTVNITDMILEYTEDKDLFVISLSDDELNDDTSGSDNISGLLSSSLDIFQRTAAFEFSSSFFKVRGLDSNNGSVLINGIEMNKLYNGRPQWSNWGGLNDVMRNQELTTGLTPSDYNFGGVLGTTNINTRASKFKQGGRVTYSSSNRSYTNRLMGSYASGVNKQGAFVVMVSRRWGNEGYQDASLYDANSFFASVEKQLGDNQSLGITAIYAPNRRGKSSPNTQEVYDLKGIKYNEYWGWQDGVKRNSRTKEVEEPIIMLNHYWDISSKTTLNTNVGYQFGKLANSRIGYGGVTKVETVDGDEVFEGGGRNPSPAYYQKLPSYFERNFPDDLEFAYGAQQEFLNNGQINWDAMYRANTSNARQGKNATYFLYEDRVDDTQLTINSILNTEINENIVLNAGVNYKKLNSENYAENIDLLGGTGVLNVDGFDGLQYDLKNSNEVTGVGDKFGYHYNIFATILNGYAQAQFSYNKIDFYVSGSFSSSAYQREGLFENEANQGNSYGKGEQLTFAGLGGKGGLTYKLSGKHVLDANVGYITKAPSIQNTFTNSRVNHDVVGIANGELITGNEIAEEKLISADVSYIFRAPIVKAKLTGFYTKIEDANETSFYYADGVAGFVDDNGNARSNEFVSEVLQGVNKKHLGAELGVEAQVTPTIKLKGAASYGQYTYDNNPHLYVSADDQVVSYGRTNLKNYKLAGGPQKAYSVGFEYRDPDYWWFGATANYFNETYVDVSSISRSSNFYTDPVDGQVFSDYDEGLATQLLKQEQFEDYMVINLVGGKSWRIDDYYLGFFASVGNLLDKAYKTGGFEQARNANYRELRDDKALNKPVFGSKYWYGRGANYFVNVYVRF